jgi:hypothetical protein
MYWLLSFMFEIPINYIFLFSQNIFMAQQQKLKPTNYIYTCLNTKCVHTWVLFLKFAQWVTSNNKICSQMDNLK